MPKVQWLGSSRADDDNRQTDPARLINCYRERRADKYVIKSVLGMSSFASLSGVFMREMQEIGGMLYAAHGGTVYKIASDGSETIEGTVADASDTTMSGNNGDIAIAADGNYYVISGGTTTSPGTGAISSVGSVSFLGQRTILTEKGGGKIQWSDVADASTYDALNFATAETRDDDLLRGEVLDGQFWAFGERSIERWYVTASADEAEFIQPIAGATVDVGLKSFGLLTTFPGGIFFIGSDNIAYLASGGQLQPVSSPSVNTSIKQGSPERCFFYEDEGQKFCVIKFATRPAWVYDLATAEWHERAEGAQFNPWTAVASANAYGEWFVGTELGGVYKLTRSNTDVSNPLIRRMVSSTYEGEERFSLDRLQIQPRAGRSDIGREAQVMVRLSRDRGETWGTEKWRSVGSLGQYGKIISLRAQGQFRRLNVELTISDPAEIPFDSVAIMDLS